MVSDLMHVALLANPDWLDHELAQFRRLVIGLFDEQVRVAQVVPQDLPHQYYSFFGDRLPWRDTSWARSRRKRLVGLSESLKKLDVDLIHALDGQLWDASVRLAQELQVPAVLSASCGADVARVKRLARHVTSGRIMFTAATQPIARAIEQRLGESSPVDFVPPGVHRASADDMHQGQGHVLCAVVSGSGLVDSDYEELFGAMAQLLAEQPQAQFFLEGCGSDQHALWQMAERFELLANVSFVSSGVGHHELLIRADVLIQPQSLGRARSLTLQAMAHGMTVLAKADPWLDYLIDDQTARLVGSHDRDQWLQLLRHVVDEPDDMRDLGDRARQWIGDRHLASQQIARTLDVYRRACGESIKFSG